MVRGVDGGAFPLLRLVLVIFGGLSNLISSFSFTLGPEIRAELEQFFDEFDGRWRFVKVSVDEIFRAMMV